MRRLLSVLWASVIAAAFLGPGTVTTAARAGAEHGHRLLWTLLFSTVACLVLQEASARLTLASGKSLGEALRSGFGAGGWLVLVLVLGAVVLGCAAYEAGNILGAVAGAELATGLGRAPLTVGMVAAAGLLLWFGATRHVVLVLSVLVAGMAAVFGATALALEPPLAELARGLLRPSVPDGSLLLVLGLVGTTVVPYNLFLGSGLVRGGLAETRFGLAVAIGLGGLVSMAVLVAGSAVAGDFSFAALAEVLARRLGSAAERGFGLGLLAAGFTSAVTAPLAAAITARGLFAKGADDPAWAERSPRYRVVWLSVLASGLVFGLSGVRPVPAIVLAQALNGLLLPFVAVFLLLAVNDRQLMGPRRTNGLPANLLGGLIVGVAVLLGALAVVRAAGSVFGFPPPGLPLLLLLGAGMLALASPLVLRTRRRAGARGRDEKRGQARG